MLKSDSSILVVDLGGTKTIIALASGNSESVQLEHVRTFASQGAASLDHLLDQYLTTVSVPPRHAMIAVAGPKQVLVDKSLFSILQKYHYLNLRLALGQSLFLVEVSLHDDSAVPVLSCGILGRALRPEGRLAML